jgi:hypothetical protein
MPLLDGKYQVCTYRQNPYGAACYRIQLNAARKLLDVAYPVRMTADDLIFRPRPAGVRSRARGAATPCSATRIAAAELDMQPEEHVLEAEEPEDFARQELAHEPEGLKVSGGLPALRPDQLKQGVV